MTAATAIAARPSPIAYAALHFAPSTGRMFELSMVFLSVADAVPEGLGHRIRA